MASLNKRNEIHENDIGTEMILTIVDYDEDGVIVDISTATTMTIIITTSDKVKTTYPAAFVTDGTDGKIHMYTVSGDLSPVGPADIQGIVQTPAGLWHTSIVKFKIIGNL